jgi:hypothetical protein
MDQRSENLLVRHKTLARGNTDWTTESDGDAMPHDKQKYRRTAVFLPAKVDMAGQTVTCDILNISAGGALIRTRDKAEIDGAITIELQDQEPLKADVVRRQDDKYGIAFQEDPKKVGALVEALLEASPHSREKRSHPRRLVLLGASFYIGDQFVQGKVNNLSAGGLRMQADTLPEPGQTIELNLGRFGTMSVYVIWADDQAMGARFLDPVTEVIKRIGHLLPNIAYDTKRR